MLQALVEFQCRAVNRQQTSNHYRRYPHRRGPPHYPRIIRIVKSGKMNAMGESSGRPGPTAGNGSHLTVWRRPYVHRVQYSDAPVQGEVLEGADKQGAGEQGRPVKRNTCCGYMQRQPREDGK
ncbi:Y-box-binding protein 1 [Manis javanica]|nr:Y-box-binding protein 1 [Manis javanica]